MFLGQFQSSQCDESNLGCTFYRSDHLMAEYGTLERKDSVPGTTMIQRDKQPQACQYENVAGSSPSGP